MKLVVLGATGPSGQAVVIQALEAGHDVTAIVRTAAKVTTTHDKLRVIEADVFSESSLQPHFESCDAVMSCLGIHGGWREQLQPMTFYSDSIKPITAAMKGAKVNRFIAMTTWCTTDGPLWMKWMLKLMCLKQLCLDMGRMEDYLAAECPEINYTVVKPPSLGAQEISGKEIKTVEGQWVPGGSSSISRGDNAKFMISCLDTNKWDNRLVSVSN